MVAIPGFTDIDWAKVGRDFKEGRLSRVQANEIIDRGIRVFEAWLIENGHMAPPNQRTRQEEMEEIERRREAVLPEVNPKLPKYKAR
jgi:hypothetical protein